MKTLDNYKESSCSCQKCKICCLSSPCLGTPEETQKIKDAGFEKDIVNTFIFDQITNTFKEVQAIKGIAWSHGGHQLMRCSMLNEQGLCRLHDKKLKPIEGRVIDHTFTVRQTQEVRHEVLKTWKDAPTYSMEQMLNKSKSED